MKSYSDFRSDMEYVDYLKGYYSGLAMQGLIANAPTGNLGNSKEGVLLAKQWALELIKALHPDFFI